MAFSVAFQKREFVTPLTHFAGHPFDTAELAALGSNEITVRDGKGAKDQFTMLLESLKAPLRDHLKNVKANHNEDLAVGWGRVQMPAALDRKYPNASADWALAVGLSAGESVDQSSDEGAGRHHIDQSLVQKAVRDVVVKTGLTRRATCHTFRHSFATHLLQADIRTVQRLLGHSDVKTTMIFTHVLNCRPSGARSPVD